jgi:monoamine oxidase
MPRVLVSGAGLAGLAAARALEAHGAEVVVIEARDRVGGRVWTIRDGFAGAQHAEAGADLIDSGQEAVVALARELRLAVVPILRTGFGFFTVGARGRVIRRSLAGGFDEVESKLSPLLHDHHLAEQRWTGAIARRLAGQSVAEWLKTARVSAMAKARIRGLRGLFLADPEELSLLALIDFFSDLGESGWGKHSRLRGGNDRLATEMARRLRRPVQLRTVLRKVVQTERGIRAAVERPSGQAEIAADYLICAMPATTLRDVVFEPGLPAPHRDAIARLRYGAATRLIVQFDRRFWRRRDRPSAYGSDQPIGAVWDGNEQQRGRHAMLSFLAGGAASREIRALIDAEGLDGVIRRLRWMGRPSSIVRSRTVVWEDDPWARGGYAFFDPSFDPELRDWLSRPAGRVFFAGEHTSVRWQGYMNGALESGMRAAAEVRAMTSSLHRRQLARGRRGDVR